MKSIAKGERTCLTGADVYYSDVGSLYVIDLEEVDDV
jgi:hypothetical protein